MSLLKPTEKSNVSASKNETSLLRMRCGIPLLTWRDSEAWGVALIVGFSLLAVLPLVLASLANSSPEGPFLVELGLNAGLLGFSLLVLQFVLSARLPILKQLKQLGVPGSRIHYERFTV